MPSEGLLRQVSKLLYPANFWQSTPMARATPVRKTESLIFSCKEGSGIWVVIVGSVEAIKRVATGLDKKTKEGNNEAAAQKWFI